MKLPRITIRRLMVLIAVVALLIAGGMETSRCMEVSRNYRQKAASCAFLGTVFLSRAKSYDDLADSVAKQAVKYEGLFKKAAASSPWTAPDRRLMALATEFIEINREREKEYRGLAAEARKEVALKASMKRKYEHAARYPWLPVESDPPEPR